MNVYIFQAALLCSKCGLDAKEDLAALAQQDSDREDSDRYPQGPYPDGGGEADCPQHCDHCGEFLENPLTPDGDTYVRTKAKEFETAGADESWEEIAVKADAGKRPALAQWIRYYFAWGQ